MNNETLLKIFFLALEATGWVVLLANSTDAFYTVLGVIAIIVIGEIRN